MFDLVDLSERCRQAADVDVSSLTDDELLAATLEWQRVVSAAELGVGQVLGELQKRGCTESRYGLKTPAWVASEAKVDRRVVVRRLRTGRHLRFLPQVCEAVVAGELTSDHAAEMALAASNPRIGDQIVAGQQFWVELARATSFVDWRHQLRHTVVELDEDGGYDPNRDLARNTLRLTPHADGLLSLTGEMVGERALTVRQAVEAHADVLFRRLDHDHDLCPELPMPKRATILAMALAELIMRGAAVDRDKTPGPAIDITLVIEAKPTNPTDTTGATGATGTIDPGNTTRSSGAATLPPLELHRNGCGDHADPHNPTDPHHADHCCGDGHAELARLLASRPVYTPDGYRVAPEVAAALVCDPAITALIVDTLGVPLDLGRQIRFANRAQRRAIAHRDGGCVFPGCDAPVGWCDAHHVTWWEKQGPTDIANLALLCRYHHGVTHRHGWTMTALADQTFTWTTPLGQTLHSQRHRGRSPTGHPNAA